MKQALVLLELVDLLALVDNCVQQALHISQAGGNPDPLLRRQACFCQQDKDSLSEPAEIADVPQLTKNGQGNPARQADSAAVPAGYCSKPLLFS